MFPFSPLPLLPQGLILKELSPFDRFKFSLVSRKCHLLAMRSKLAVRNMSFRFTKDHTDILIKGPSKANRLQLHFPINMQLYGFEEIAFQAWIDDIGFRVSLSSSTRGMLPTMVADNQNQEGLIETCIRRLCDILEIRGFSMEIEGSSILPCVLQTTRTFESVCASFSRSPYKDEASILLNDISVDDFTLSLNGTEDYQQLQPLKHRRMFLDNAAWFTKEVLMSLECEELSVYYPNITSEDLQEFFEAWKEGKFPKLKKLEILTLMDLERILDFAPVDEEDWQVIKDAGGNVGKLRMSLFLLEFAVVF